MLVQVIRWMITVHTKYNLVFLKKNFIKVELNKICKNIFKHNWNKKILKKYLNYFLKSIFLIGRTKEDEKTKMIVERLSLSTEEGESEVGWEANLW